MSSFPANRREFLQAASLMALGLTTAGGVTLSALGLKTAPSAKQLKNWVWIPTNTERSADDWKHLFAQARDAGIHGVLLEVYNGREAYFPSQRLPVKTDWLGQILPLAKSAELEVHAWMWSMPCMIDEIRQKHPDWYNVNARGESAVDKPAYVDYYKFLDPGRPEVREWISGTVKELANIAELTGIHLDYIRHPDAILPRGLWKKYNIVQDKIYPQYDYGYTEYNRNSFKTKFGTDPLYIKDARLESEWLQFRLEMVTDLVNQYLVPAARAKNKKITAAVFPGPSLAKQNVRQDWGQWNLDAFFPMLYHVFYEQGPEWVRERTREAVSAVKKPVYSGVFIHDLQDSEFHQTAQMAMDGAASGISLFSIDGMNSAKWVALKNWMQNASAFTKHSSCWTSVVSLTKQSVRF